MNELYSIHQLKTVLAPVFSRHGVHNAILFGSYAKGSATAQSDVDLLVNSGLRGMAFYGLLEDVASSLRVPVDLIDTTQIEPDSEIDREIRKSGVTIYGQ